MLFGALTRPFHAGSIHHEVVPVKDEEALASTKLLTLSVEEAGRALGIGRPLAYRLVREGRLPVMRLGRRLRVSKPALDEMLKRVRPEREEL